MNRYSFSRYLAKGGFPEAQNLSAPERSGLLQGYVDMVLFRNAIERRGGVNGTALRHLVRRPPGSPAGLFSLQKIFRGYEVAARRRLPRHSARHAGPSRSGLPASCLPRSHRFRKAPPRESTKVLSDRPGADSRRGPQRSRVRSSPMRRSVRCMACRSRSRRTSTRKAARRSMASPPFATSSRRPTVRWSPTGSAPVW